MTTSTCPRCGAHVSSDNFGGWTGCHVGGRPLRSPVCKGCSPGYFGGGCRTEVVTAAVILAVIVAFKVWEWVAW